MRVAAARLPPGVPILLFVESPWSGILPRQAEEAEAGAAVAAGLRTRSRNTFL